jgi:hypothetical protein
VDDGDVCVCVELFAAGPSLRRCAYIPASKDRRGAIEAMDAVCGSPEDSAAVHSLAKASREMRGSVIPNKEVPDLRAWCIILLFEWDPNALLQDASGKGSRSQLSRGVADNYTHSLLFD